MGLTTKQERFCQLLVTESKTLTDAYIGSYDTSNMKQQSIYQLSSRLSNQVNIRYRINQLTEQISNDSVSKVVWDRSKIISELSINVDLGRETKQLAASNQAIKLIGSAVGNVFEPETIAVSGTVSVIHSLSDAQLDQLVALGPSEPVAIDDSEAIEAESYKLLEPEP
jgi:hypothetical protein